MDTKYLKIKILEEIKKRRYENHYRHDFNPNSPVEDDKRKWYLCNLCDYSSLSYQGIAVHLGKYHKLGLSSGSMKTDRIIDICLDVIEKESNK